LITWLVSCAWGQSAPSPPPATVLTIGSTTVSVEIADDPAEREHGLMKRETLGADQGMLFVYPDERPRNFWMKDTSLPLSIAYLDAQGRIVRIADMTPFDTSTVPSVRPAMYALEVNQGWFTRHTIQVGASVKGVPPPSAH
jgi:uncharacterized membrane protein (UPF0127 family)